VRHDEDALHAEQVGREEEGALHVVGNAGTGIAQDLHISRKHAHNSQRINA
jgi:hypothetical protein